MTISIRPMVVADAQRVAELHREGIPQGFLSRLSSPVRAEMYRGIAVSPRSGVWVATLDNGEVVGFISGTAHVRSCYRSVLLRRGIVMAWHAAPSLLHPSTWKQAYETLTYPRREIDGARQQASSQGPEPTAELLSIVVDKHGRGTGTAGRLVLALETALAQWQHHGPYRVVTMAADPLSNGFYRKVGFQHVREFQHHGVPMNLYHKEPVAS